MRSDRLLSGTVVGGVFCIESVLGTGARGEVYLATDTALDRRVVLRFPVAMDERVTRTIARLAHPNLVTVHEVGEHEGRVYMAMEFVEGGNAKEWLATGRSWREVLGVLVQAGRGLAAAHAAGLVHGGFTIRDVLLGLDRRARVTGFGFAPAPESDKLAFCHALKESLPDPPGWLRAIVEREDRFADMDALLVALQNDPTPRRIALAGAVGVLGLGLGAWGWLALDERNRRAHCEEQANAIDEAWNDEASARLHDALLGVGVPFAESTFAHARPILDEYAARWRDTYRNSCVAAEVEGTLSSWADTRRCLEEQRAQLVAVLDVLSTTGTAIAVLQTTDVVNSMKRVDLCLDDGWLARNESPASDTPMERSGLLRVQMLSTTGRYAEAQELVAELVDEVADEDIARRVPILLSAGKLASLTERKEEAGRLQREAFDLAIAAGYDSGAMHAAIALASLRGADASRFDEALRWGRIATALVERVGADDDVTAVDLHAQLSMVHHARGRLDDAERECVEALRICGRALGAEHPTCGVLHNDLGLVQLNRGRYADAEQEFTRALEARSQAVGSDHPDIAHLQINLGRVQRLRGDLVGAERSLRLALATTERVLGPEDPVAATAWNALGVLFGDQGRYAESEEAYRRSLAITGPGAPSDQPDIAISQANLAFALMQQSEYAEAEAELSRALAIAERAFGPEHEQVASMRDRMGQIHLAQERFAEAQREMEHALSSRIAALDPSHPDIARSHVSLGRLHRARAEWADAEREFLSALQISERALGPDHRDGATIHHELALLYVAQRRWAEAEPHEVTALQIRERVLPASHPHRAASVELLAEIRSSLGGADH